METNNGEVLNPPTFYPSMGEAKKYKSIDCTNPLYNVQKKLLRQQKPKKALLSLSEQAPIFNEKEK